MAREPRNIGASVRARLLERARTERSDFQILLTRYAIERLLYRLSVSPFRDLFVLKGAMLFVTWVADPFRPTRDLDLLGFGDDEVGPLAETFRAICAQAVEADGVSFDIDGLTAEPIRKDVDYGGVRVRTSATIAAARIPIQIDIGFGDAITPGAIEIDYPVLLDTPVPKLRAYPVETVIAEKFEALVTLGMANSRLKDFYDLWMISRTFELRRCALAAAVRATFTRRGSSLPVETPAGLMDDFVAVRSAQWTAFVGRERMAAAPASLSTVITDLRAFLLPLIRDENSEWLWSPQKGWQQLAEKSAPAE